MPTEDDMRYPNCLPAPRVRLHAAALGLTAVLGLCSPAHAQDAPPAEPDSFERGLEQLGEGARLLWEGFRNEADPALRDLMAEMGPAWSALRAEIDPLMEDLGERVGSLNAYERPVMLPNGDILIRRREPLDGFDGDMTRENDNRDQTDPVEL